MPAKSEAQQKAAALALQAKKGQVDVKSLKGAAKQMYDSMTANELEKFASTKHKDIPEKVKEEEMNEATTSASSGAYETPFGVSSKQELKMLDNLKENKLMNITVEQIEKIVKRTLIREEVYSEKPSTSSTMAFNQTGEGKGKETSTKNAKNQKTYASKAGKSTDSNSKKSGEESKKSTADSIKKVGNNQTNNMKDANVVDVNKNKIQNDDQRIEAHQNGMEDLTYDNISDEKQKKNTEYLKNEAALDNPNAQDTGVEEQMIDDAKKRKKSKEDSKFRTAKVYGSDVEYIDGAESAQSKKLAYENTMKRLKFKTQFKDDKDMLSRIPSKYKNNDTMFEMYDGENKYKIRWEGNTTTGVGVILEHRNEKQEKMLYERMMHLSNFDKKNTNPDFSDKTAKDIFKGMLKEAKDLSDTPEVNDLSTLSESKVFNNMLKEAKIREEQLLKEEQEKKKINEVALSPVGDATQNEYIRRNPLLTRMVQAALNNLLNYSPQLRVDGIAGKNTNTAIWIYNKRFNNDEKKRYLDVDDLKVLFSKLAGTGWTGGVGKGQKNDKRDVYTLQTLLNWTLGKNLVVDGIYGRNTQAAIDEFHKKLNINGGKAGQPFGKESWYAMRRSGKSQI
jgi:peptidoglycan hydrolase-like protein with peptidoglycan-binding domain